MKKGTDLKTNTIRIPGTLYLSFFLGPDFSNSGENSGDILLIFLLRTRFLRFQPAILKRFHFSEKKIHSQQPPCSFIFPIQFYFRFMNINDQKIFPRFIYHLQQWFDFPKDIISAFHMGSRTAARPFFRQLNQTCPDRIWPPLFYAIVWQI